MSKSIHLNARDLSRELDWLKKILDASLNSYANQEVSYAHLFDIKPPYLTRSKSGYAQILRDYKVSFVERLLLILALAPHIKPQVLEGLLAKNPNTGLRITEYGGVFHPHQSHFLPTGETILFILSGNDLKLRFEIMEELAESRLWNDQIVLDFRDTDGNLSKLKRPLVLTEQYLHQFTFNTLKKQTSELKFPAQKIATKLEWKDLIVNRNTLSQIQEIEVWTKHEQTLMEDWNFKSKIKPGYRALFHGSSGTGKTLAVKLLGKSTKKEVYRVDLSRIISKYIGETEKNISKVFARAKNNNWILFFDEADALFGKRTSVSDAQDRYANQEVSYLLQRMEDFNGLVILATDKKEDINEVFLRRFQSIIHFPMPDAEARLQLWKKGFPTKAKIASDINLAEIAQKYELSGAGINQVIQFASLQAIARGDNTITQNDLTKGIRNAMSTKGT